MQRDARGEAPRPWLKIQGTAPIPFAAVDWFAPHAVCACVKVEPHWLARKVGGRIARRLSTATTGPIGQVERARRRKKTKGAPRSRRPSKTGVNGRWPFA